MHSEHHFHFPISQHFKEYLTKASDQRSGEDVEQPKLSLALCYNGTLERLTVAVYDCKDLLVTDLVEQHKRKS